MKYAVWILIAMVALQSVVPAQEKPVSQEEFVEMLKALPSTPQRKQAVVDALRQRGIGFVLTDGLRSYARTKGANDDELKRVLEEAERRRQNPTLSQPPSEAEAAAVLKDTTKNTLEAVDEMPDFVVKQQIQRSVSYAGTNNFRNIDRLLVAVSYRSTGEEDYKLLSINGIIQTNATPRGSYEQAGGTSSTGEFVMVLSTIFKPESKTTFQVVDSDVVRGRRAVVFDFSIERDRAKQVITAAGSLTNSTVAGMKGRIWIDRELSRVLRIESEATEIPASFPVTAARRNIDYDWVTIDKVKYLLPSLSDVRVTVREKDRSYETRNVIRFREYQKYGSEVRILDDDNDPAP